MTLTLFSRLYGHYKADWDMEMRLRAANCTYAEAFIRAQKDEEWL